jgi:hypothetical protein
MSGLTRARASRPFEALLGFALVLAVLAPMLLGPALGPLTRALGGTDEHRCACGMVQGECGCPECEALEHQRLREHAPRPYPVLRSQCGGDDVASGFAALPPALPLRVAFVLPPPRTSLLTLERPSEALSREMTEPATPPPRRARV